MEMKAQLEATRKGVRVPAESKHALMPIVLNDLQLLAKKGQRVVTAVRSEDNFSAVVLCDERIDDPGAVLQHCAALLRSVVLGPPTPH